MNYTLFALSLMAFEIKNIIAEFVVHYIRKDSERDKRYYLFRQKMRSLDPLSDEYRRMFLASLKHPYTLYIPGLEYAAFFSIQVSISFFIITSAMDTVNKVDQSTSLKVLGVCVLYAFSKCMIDALKTYGIRTDSSSSKEDKNVIELKRVA